MRLAAALAGLDAPRLAIPGGSAARAVGTLRALLGPQRWSRVRLTWVDERCVAYGDPDSNRGEAWRQGLLVRDAPPAFELALFEDGESPAGACARVREQLAARFDSRIDVALLGLGEDGHVASLFPGRRVEGPLVAAVEDSPKPPARRITLTLPMLRTARTVVVLATGEAKRAALLRLLDGDAALPASALDALEIVTDLSLDAGGAR